MRGKTFTHTFHGDPAPVDPQAVMAQMFGAPSAADAEREADHLMALLIGGDLSPAQIIDYLECAPWGATDADEPEASDGAPATP